MRILIVEDELRYAQALARSLHAEGVGTVAIATRVAEARKRLMLTPWDLVVSDLRLPDGSGLDLIREAREHNPALAAVLMTAYADVDTARGALKAGALDYLVKPFRLEELSTLVRRIKEQHPAEDAPRPQEMIGASAPMRQIFTDIQRAARGDVTVLLLGESGTGKELAARAIHDASARRSAPFIEAHLAALPESLLESELFGHERGAFTGAEQRRAGIFEMANHGTVFLDEIGELPLHIQPKLLRVLQERRFFRLGGSEEISIDVRLITATNRDLQAEVETGRFRHDLYYRLDVFGIRMPPLRQRSGDIPLLAKAFLERKGAQLSFSSEVLEVLAKHPWPGNVRELANAIDRAALCVGEDQVIRVEHLPDRLRQAASMSPMPEKSGDANLDFQEHQRRLIADAIRQAGGNKTKAAGLMGISRRRLYSRMRSLGMPTGAAGEEDEEPDGT